MASIKTTRNAAGHCLAILCAFLLVSCSSGNRSAVEGVLLFDEVVVLTRGEKIDSGRREFAVDGDSTYVAMADEDDTGVTVTMSHSGAHDVSPVTVAVDSVMESDGLEIAVLDAPRGSRLTISLEGTQTFDRPGKVRLKVLRYDNTTSSGSDVVARLAAYRAWAAATDTRITGDDFGNSAFRDINLALAHFESPTGDPELAGWAWMVRSRLNYRQLTDLRASLADAEHAERAFAALGDKRNAARARFQQAAALVEIASDKAAKDPGPDEAAARARQLLIEISNEPAMSPLERAKAVNYLGVLAFHVYDLAESRARFIAVLPAFEAMGSESERIRVLANLGAIATEEGDYRGATRYYDDVVANLHRFESTQARAMLLYNAARIDTYAGNIDRAIERFLRALEITRIDKVKSNEARILIGLGIAYWVRGDTAQATALSDAALSVGREIDDTPTLSGSLGVVGALAREAGDIPKALALHREMISRAASADVRVLALKHLALDYQAASDYPRALATAREAWAVQMEQQNTFRRFEVQLALADILLSQPRRTPEATREAAALALDSLNAAVARGDTTQEIAARRLLAQSHVATGKFRDARDEYEKAIALIFKYRSTINNPELRATALAQEQQAFRGYVDLLMRDAARRAPDKLLPATAYEEEALRTLEWARALNFDSRRFPRLEAEAQAQLDEFLVQMAGKRVRIESLSAYASESKREIELLQLDIARLRAEIDGLRAGAQHGVNSPDSPAGAPSWPALSAGVTQISYALETRDAYVWVRDASGLRVTKLAATSANIARELETLTKAVRARTAAQLDASLARLSLALLPPEAIAADTTTLEFVAEGQITRVPFAALSARAGAAKPLSQLQSIVMVDSMFEPRVVPPSGKPHKWGFVALANDARSTAASSAGQVFPALPTTNAEARAIAAMFQKLDPAPQVKLLFGKDGTAGSLKGIWQDGIDAIHFATHGLADLRQPLASLLLLPALDVSGNPAYLTAGQVQEWRGDANLVYLSACETAVGPARFADGLPGLQRAFLRAGARGVIATLWPVEDIYASQFASDFYRRYTAGIPAARALNETQHAWMEPVAGDTKGDALSRRMTAWAHAFYAQ